MSESKPRRRLSLIDMACASLVIGAIIGAVAGGIGARTGDGLSGPIMLAVIVIGMAVALVLAVIWWRGADEAVREAHKWAWWWGGSSGMAVGAVILLALQYSPTRVPEIEAMGGTAALTMGIGGLLMLQGVGYVIAWAWWWLSRR